MWQTSRQLPQVDFEATLRRVVASKSCTRNMERNTAPPQKKPPQTLVIAFPQIAVAKFNRWEGKKEK
jgi:hypothetical protein